MRIKNIRALVIVITALCTASTVLAERQVAQSTDLGARDFKADEIVRALVPRESPAEPSAKSAQRRTRGLGVVRADAVDSQVAAPPRRGVSMQIQFDFDSAGLTESASTRLDEVGKALRSPELGTGRFLVIGHTDAAGTRAYNLGLSARRADAVRDYLVQRHGIDAMRLLAMGKAADELLDVVDPNSIANRRVQIETID